MIRVEDKGTIHVLLFLKVKDNPEITIGNECWINGNYKYVY